MWCENAAGPESEPQLKAARICACRSRSRGDSPVPGFTAGFVWGSRAATNTATAYRAWREAERQRGGRESCSGLGACRLEACEA